MHRDWEKAYHRTMAAVAAETENPVSLENQKLLHQFMRDIDLDKFSRPINYYRRLKYIHVWKLLDKWFACKPFKKITRKQFEDWYLDLKTDKLTRDNGLAYSQNTKATFRAQIKLIWKWLKGDNVSYPPEVRHFKNNFETKKIKDVFKEDVEKVANRFTDFRYKFATLFLLDSGFRIDEFISMRKKDLRIETDDEGNEYYVAYCPRSKTQSRYVDVQLYPEHYQQYISEYCSGDGEQPLFKATYEAYLKQLKVISRLEIKQKITPHDLRKASATYYGTVYGDLIALNKRLGWGLASRRAEIYINRKGGRKEAVQKIQNNEVVHLRKKMKGYENQLQDLRQRSLEHDKVSAILLEVAKTPAGKRLIKEVYQKQHVEVSHAESSS